MSDRKTMNFMTPQRSDVGNDPSFSPILRGGKSLSQKVQKFVHLDRVEDQEIGAARNWKHIQKLSGSIPTMFPLVKNTEKMSQSQQYSTNPFLKGEANKQSQEDCSWKNEHQEIEVIRRKMEQYEKDLCNMTMEITKLRKINETQKQSFEDLNKAVQARHMSIEEVLIQTQKAMQEQTNLMSKQDYIIQKLMDDRRRHDRLTDLGFLFFGLYLARSPLMKYTVLLLYGQLATSKRPQKWLFQYLQIFVLFNVYFFARLANDKMAISDRLLKGIYTLSKMTQLGLGSLLLTSLPASLLGRRQTSVNSPSYV